MIIDILKEKFPDKPLLRVRDIKIDKTLRRINCVISTPASQPISPETEREILSAVRQVVPQGFKVYVKIVADSFNEKSVVAFLLDYIAKNYPLFTNIKKDKISAEVSQTQIKVTFTVSDNTRRNMEVAEFLPDLEKFFQSYTSYNVSFALKKDETATLTSADIAAQERLVHLAINKELLKPQRYFNVSDVRKYIGKLIAAKPMYIADIRTAMESCTVCGKISDKQLKEVKSNPTLRICKFNLTDGSDSTLPCIAFVRLQIEDFETLKQTNVDKTDSELQTLSRTRRLANEKKLKLFAFLANDTEVLVRGKVAYSSFSERLEMRVYDLCKCQIEPLMLQPKFERQAPESYLLVKPQSLAEYRQMNFIQAVSKPSPLQGKELTVVFANVTGQKVTRDKIYKICAVRLSNGHLKEKLCTLVSPELPLTDEQLSKVGANLRELSVNPTITEVISDLFKFFGDASVVGDDLPVIFEILNYYGAPLGYNFKNPLKSYAALLSSLYDKSVYDSKPNCSDIAEVLKNLKLPQKLSDDCEDKAVALSECISALCSAVK